MRYSQFFLATLKEDPAEAELISHKLMLRSGMIRKLAAGVYSFLPLGYRVIKKVEAIIREEMERSGAQEVLLPALCPAHLWQESGRWEAYGDELMRLKDRHQRDFCLGPTHEEVITDLVRRQVRSYRQLPLNLYQIQTKFRDEIRPRFGLMRGREFIMKDGYSFDRDEAGTEAVYQEMYQAYTRIFQRCGLDFKVVEADTGAIGGKFSHEFMVLAAAGEEEIVSCTKCDYTANAERMPCQAPPPGAPVVPAAKSKVHTPGVKSAADLASFFKKPLSLVLKSLIFQADDQVVFALVRGDHELNEQKLKKYLGCKELKLADEVTVQRVSGALPGFASPVGTSGYKVIADLAVEGMGNFIAGANEEDYHLVEVNLGRDFPVNHFVDLRKLTQDDPCPQCGGQLRFQRGIEVGHVFKLGDKYSQAMGATYLDENGKEQNIIMGCYGIGVGRTAAAAIEQNHDQNGIIWPLPLAPFQVLILPLNIKEERVMSLAEKLYAELEAKGLEVLLDDRNERPGAKFKDADLLGIPLRVNIGPRDLKQGLVEIKLRKSGEVIKLKPEEVTAKLFQLLEEIADNVTNG